MKVWNNTSKIVRAIESNGIAMRSKMVVENDKIYFLYYEYSDDEEPTYIYALEDYWLDKQYPNSYKPELAGDYPIVQDAHFNPEYVGFNTKGMSIYEIIKKFEQNKKKYL